MSQPIMHHSSASQLSLVRVGGAMGIAACAVGLLVFLAACAGLNAALVMSIIPLLLSAAGLVSTVLGGIMQSGDADLPAPQVVAALFINLAGLIGAGILVAVWRGWSIFAGQGG